MKTQTQTPDETEEKKRGELTDREIEHYQYLVREHPDLPSAEIAKRYLEHYDEEVPEA